MSDSLQNDNDIDSKILQSEESEADNEMFPRINNYPVDVSDEKEVSKRNSGDSMGKLKPPLVDVDGNIVEKNSLKMVTKKDAKAMASKNTGKVSPETEADESNSKNNPLKK